MNAHGLARACPAASKSLGVHAGPGLSLAARRITTVVSASAPAPPVTFAGHMLTWHTICGLLPQLPIRGLLLLAWTANQHLVAAAVPVAAARLEVAHVEVHAC
jgi:hypothetical protein